jgi:hypothetical protein
MKDITPEEVMSRCVTKAEIMGVVQCEAMRLVLLIVTAPLPLEDLNLRQFFPVSQDFIDALAVLRDKTIALVQQQLQDGSIDDDDVKDMIDNYFAQQQQIRAQRGETI